LETAGSEDESEESEEASEEEEEEKRDGPKSFAELLGKLTITRELKLMLDELGDGYDTDALEKHLESPETQNRAKEYELLPGAHTRRWKDVNMVLTYALKLAQDVEAGMEERPKLFPGDGEAQEFMRAYDAAVKGTALDPKFVKKRMEELVELQRSVLLQERIAASAGWNVAAGFKQSYGTGTAKMSDEGQKALDKFEKMAKKKANGGEADKGKKGHADAKNAKNEIMQVVRAELAKANRGGGGARGRGAPTGEFRGTCYNCGEWGHSAGLCTKQQRQRGVWQPRGGLRGGARGGRGGG
jgi:hypothetical protein